MDKLPINDIPITILNATGKNDFMIVVFTKNADVNAIETPFVAWHTIKVQTSASLVYPVDVAVGASWQMENAMDIDEAGCSSAVRYQAGPFSAGLGSTWQITMPFHHSSPDMKTVTTAPLNGNNAIVVKNMKPASWAGRPFHFGLYKAGKLLVMQQDVGIGSQAVFTLTPKLFIGVVKDMRNGDVFRSLTITQAYFEVDLNDFVNGVIIKVKMHKASGEFFFSAQNT